MTNVVRGSDRRGGRQARCISRALITKERSEVSRRLLWLSRPPSAAASRYAPLLSSPHLAHTHTHTHINAPAPWFSALHCYFEISIFSKYRCIFKGINLQGDWLPVLYLSFVILMENRKYKLLITPGFFLLLSDYLLTCQWLIIYDYSCDRSLATSPLLMTVILWNKWMYLLSNVLNYIFRYPLQICCHK